MTFLFNRLHLNSLLNNLLLNFINYLLSNHLQHRFFISITYISTSEYFDHHIYCTEFLSIKLFPSNCFHHIFSHQIISHQIFSHPILFHPILCHRNAFHQQNMQHKIKMPMGKKTKKQLPSTKKLLLSNKRRTINDVKLKNRTTYAPFR